jgi:succinoglycan biosynthesis transport protein ExoP
MELRRQIAFGRAWWPLIIVSVLLAGGAAFVVGDLQQKVYEAKTTLIVGQSLSAVNPNYDQLLVSQRLSTTYARLATTRPVLASVIKDLGLDTTPDDLGKRVSANAAADSTLLSISAQDPDPTRAAAIANMVAKELISAATALQGTEGDLQRAIDQNLVDTQRQLSLIQSQVDALLAIPNRTALQEANLRSLQDRQVSLSATYATLLTFSSNRAPNLLSEVEPAVAPLAPASPRPLVNALIGGILGLFVAVSLVIVIEYLDQRVNDPDVVQQVAGLSTLGVVARMKGDSGRGEMYRLATLLDPRSATAEAYRTLRTNLEFASVDSPLGALLVTSAVPSEGKTVTAANLAVAFAQAGRRVLLVDADLRKPGIHRIFNLENTAGLATVLRSDEAALDLVVRKTEQENLTILTTGTVPPNPAELLGSQRMRTVLDRLRAAYDLLIVDSPPVQAFTDAAILSSFLDATLVVVDARRSRRGAVRGAREALALAGAHVLGVVINRIPAGDRSGLAGYYGDYYATAAGGEAKPSAPKTSATESVR